MIVVIDGPAGSGKSSTARAVAERLQIQFLDSGALYRVATLLYLNANRDYSTFIEQLKKSKISFYFKNRKFNVFLNAEEVTQAIREMKISEHVSEVAAFPAVRAYVNDLMRNAVRQDVYIADGRDLGTAVFPDAELKFFMIADLETRARRRFEEIEQSGQPVSMDEIKLNLSQRDQQDLSREADPLAKADDAILIDTSELTFDEQVTMICDRINTLITEQQN